MKQMEIGRYWASFKDKPPVLITAVSLAGAEEYANLFYPDWDEIRYDTAQN